MAVPDPALYYLAAQVQHVRGWENIEFSDTNVQILKSFFDDPNLYEVLEFKGIMINSKRCPTLYLMHKVWWKLRDMYGIVGCTTYTPIWRTPWLPELRKLDNYESWKSKGLRGITQLIAVDGNP